MIITMGISSGYIKDPSILSLVTLIGLITIAGSSYFMVYGEKIYHLVKPVLKLLPGIWNKEYKKINEHDYDIIIFGYGRF
ncbi:MAG: hypothetical protein WCH65_07360 [bacterium]